MFGALNKDGAEKHLLPWLLDVKGSAEFIRSAASRGASDGGSATRADAPQPLAPTGVRGVGSRTHPGGRLVPRAHLARFPHPEALCPELPGSKGSNSDTPAEVVRWQNDPCLETVEVAPYAWSDIWNIWNRFSGAGGWRNHQVQKCPFASVGIAHIFVSPAETIMEKVF